MNGIIAALLGVMVTGGVALLVWGLRPVSYTHLTLPTSELV